MLLGVGGTKGGTGKTTLATNLAAWRARDGIDILVVDADPQGSAATWAGARSEHELEPRVQCVTLRGSKITRNLIDLGQRYSDVIVDTGGRDAPELRCAIAACDVLITPIQASQYDVDTLEAMSELLEQASAMRSSVVDARVVLTRVPTHPQMREWQEAREVVREYEGLDLAEAMIRERVAWRRTSDGYSLAELTNRDSKAEEELSQLYRSIYAEATA